MKRILIFSLAYDPFIGGAEVALREITNRMDPAAYAFDMITLHFDRALPRVEKIGNITVHRIGFAVHAPKVSDRALPFALKLAKVLFPFTAFFKAMALARTTRVDLIWAMMANQAALAALFFRWMHPRTPYLLELQDGNSLSQVKARRPIVRLLWPLYRRLYLDADMIKAISGFIEKLAREIGYRGPIAVIPNAVDTKKFSAPVSGDRLAELRAHYNKREGETWLFSASRLVLSRGVEDVIRTLPLLPPEVKFFIAGDGEDREKLEAIAREAGVLERVMFAGYKSHDELPALMRLCDIFVRPSIIEGFGNAFVEAFAAGLPVIATPIGGIPDFLFDPEQNPKNPPTGLFCEVRNPESIARAVRRLMNDCVLREVLVKNARALALEKYDWDLIAEHMRERIFERMTDEG